MPDKWATSLLRYRRRAPTNVSVDRSTSSMYFQPVLQDTCCHKARFVTSIYDFFQVEIMCSVQSRISLGSCQWDDCPVRGDPAVCAVNLIMIPSRFLPRETRAAHPATQRRGLPNPPPKRNLTSFRSSTPTSPQSHKHICFHGAHRPPLSLPPPVALILISPLSITEGLGYY
jgi:hypothetical protein